MKRFYKIVAIMFLVVFAGIILFLGIKINTHNNNFKNNQVEANHYSKKIDNNKKDKDNHSQTFGVTKFNKINFDIYEPDIQVSHGNKYQVTLAGEDLNKIKVKVKNQVLTISDAGRQAFAHDNGSYQVLITVPDINAIKEMMGYSHDGDIYLNDVSISKINFNTKYGDIDTDDVKIQDSKLRLSNGDLKVTNSTLANSSIHSDNSDMFITNSKFKVTAFLTDGDVKIKNSQMLGNSTFKTVDGDFKMINPSQMSYYLSTDPTSTIKFRGNNKLSHFSFVVDKAPTLKVTSKYGDMVIN
ncbi:MAG: DUF4097 family beta strand repeat protein [Candidatus Schmidhempelia sp.]|uniref:DUF4097 family beta strand repeat-containing protein n=1 Tax=unclassified Lactobacillus TaxID=2620435 RepID=UPI000EFBC37A|nr:MULTISPECIES: DUF4097 family beta strand repeat-containing protein [unclassified Lactobacillus]MCO6525027.1 DUF4097 family beta strand repeat protein [Candidatus Schmidhempelia sp.]RMC39101.1 hypothetical protein F5ESL0237_04845 [Lactobacillus sp. ESL0237]RMC43384.1 hypothetical protein F5ESL0234_04850 [Lactobacillus sp. ESL0234]RMC44296.1 hypothetical protein F5ESL0236_04855 [Lactobacillus sp. ESL0236]